MTPTSALPRDLPISIALSGDEFNPWTKSTHRIRFYEQPIIERIQPTEIDVGKIDEVYVFAAEDSEFFEPMAQIQMAQVTEVSEEDTEQPQKQATAEQLSPMKCKFGRFGETNAVFLNTSAIKCTTPPTDEPADSIYRETVTFSVAMNGMDFEEDKSEVYFTFVGTAPYISFATIVMTLLAIAFVGFALTLCTSDWYSLSQLD
mmetsp:Transcript_9900/g.16638  ORF Transcript_9900/g.16638 Transcript_9900/m.16638 type:complete len:203 (-) Transcript_9900:105-713(-)